MFGITFALIVAMSVPAYAASAPFSDVPTTAPYYAEVMYCKENGITSGVGNNMFAPNNPVSNFEAATMIVRAFRADMLEEGVTAMDVCFRERWLEGWNTANPYGQITLSDLITLALHAKGLYDYKGNAMETAIDMGLYAAGENGSRVAKRSDCAYLIGKLAVNTYTPNWDTLKSKMNMSVDSGYERKVERVMQELSRLPDSVISKWDASGNVLTVGPSVMNKFVSNSVTSANVVTGYYYKGSISVLLGSAALHEFGHFVYYSTAYKDVSTKVQECYNKYKSVAENVLSYYSSTNRDEFFAECFALYCGKTSIGDMEVFKEQLPDMYNLLVDMEANNWGM